MNSSNWTRHITSRGHHGPTEGCLHAESSTPTGFVGRVGALAVALGVGGVIAALPAVAVADTTGSAGSVGSDSVADRGRPASRTASGDDVAGPTTTHQTEPGTVSGARSGQIDPIGSTSRSGRHGSAGPAPAAAAALPVLPRPAIIAPSPPAAASEPFAVGVGGGSSKGADTVADSSASAVPTVVTASAAVPVTLAAPAPHLAAATPARPIQALGARLLSWLNNGGGDGTPAAAPLAWTAAAASRRELGGGGVAAVAKAPKWVTQTWPWLGAVLAGGSRARSWSVTAPPITPTPACSKATATATPTMRAPAVLVPATAATVGCSVTAATATTAATAARPVCTATAGAAETA